MDWGLAAALAAAIGSQSPTVEIVHRSDASLFGRSAFSHYMIDGGRLFAGLTVSESQETDLPLQRDEATIGAAFKYREKETAVAMKLSTTSTTIAATHTTGPFQGVLNIERTKEDDHFGAGMRWHGSGTLRTEGMIVSISGGDDATPDLMRNAYDIRKPIGNEALLGHEAIFDAPLDARDPQSYMGIAIGMRNSTSVAGMSIRSGTRDGWTGDESRFDEAGLLLAHNGTRWRGSIDGTVQERQGFYNEYSSRIRLEGCGRIGRFDLCSGAYARGTGMDISVPALATTARGMALETRMSTSRGQAALYAIHDLHVGMNERVTRVGTSYEQSSGRIERATIEIREEAKQERREFKDLNSLGYRASMELRITGKVSAGFDYGYQGSMGAVRDAGHQWSVSMKVRR